MITNKQDITFLKQAQKKGCFSLVGKENIDSFLRLNEIGYITIDANNNHYISVKGKQFLKSK